MIQLRPMHHSLIPRFAAAVAVFFGLLVIGTGSMEIRAGDSQSGPPTEFPVPLDPRVPLPAVLSEWVERTLASMSLHERVGQVLMVRGLGKYYPEDDAQRQELIALVQDLSLGGVVLFRSQAYAAAALLKDLQKAAADAESIPLIIAADFEWGADFRIAGAVPFPTAMAVGATEDEMAAEWMGEASARDARALGVHWVLAPVADVNINPRNPVINVRSFGENPEHVGRMAAAFVRGAQQRGVLATAKHFPGHGDTALDSHISLPVLEADVRRLHAVELTPFLATIKAGVGSIMTAHMAVPALTADDALPATLSAAVLTDLLRKQLEFSGLVVTDAMEMGGISSRWWSGAAAIEAILAGADVILLPPFPRAVLAALVRAVEGGELPSERLDAAVRRVLEAKARLGLTEFRVELPLAGLPGRFAPAAAAVRAQQVADAAVTLLRDPQGLLPVDSRRPLQVTLVGISDSNEPAPTEILGRELRRRLETVRAYSVDGRTRGDESAAIVAAAASADILVLAVRVRVRSSAEHINLPPRQEATARMLSELKVPTVLVALGSPYAIASFPEASAALAVYGWKEPEQVAAARALVGEIPLRGRLPVTIPGLYPIGHGVERPHLDTRLRTVAGAGTHDGNSGGVEAIVQGEVVALAAALEVMERSVQDGAFPGAVYAVGHANRIVALEAVGRMSSSPNARLVDTNAIFDLASVTKVVATTTVAMRAVETGALRLDYLARALVPELTGEGAEAITIWHLLTHTSGLPAYVEYYRDFRPEDAGASVRAEILERIYSTDLEAPAGSRYAYSDLGIIVLGEILTRVLGEPYWEYATREIFEPLGMSMTTWNPPPEWRERIPPTEQDAWRGRTVWGEVHDENTYAMGGISSHAGLFSTVKDLAVFAQMLLNHGTYDHRRFLLPSTVNTWTRRQNVVEGSSRALGWDTGRPSRNWAMFSESAYGHTGFTGTSIWIDPDRDLFVILLTNRVNPTRENRKHIQARIDFHRTVVDAIDAACGR